MRRTSLFLVLGVAALGGCAANKKDNGDGPGTATSATGTNGGAANGAATMGTTAGTNNSSLDNGGSNGGTDSDGGSTTGAVNGSATFDESDPPVATAACGEDLDVHNGTVTPDMGDVKAGSFDDDPLADGPLEVVSLDMTLKNPDSSRNDYAVTTYAPSTNGTDIDAGPFPMFVLLPGFSGMHTGYRHFTDHFVSHGVAVLGVTAANVAFTDAPNNPANVEEIEAAIKWALEESPLAGKIDEEKLAIGGHSQGGKLAFFTAVTDPRFKLVVGWDPQNGGGAPCFVGGFVGQDCTGWPVAPVCDNDRSFEDAGMMQNIRAETIVFAARDTNVTPDSFLWAEHFYRGAPSPAHMMLFPSAGHGDWGAAGGVTDTSKRIQMAMILNRFFGKSGAELDQWLPGDGADLASVDGGEWHTK